MVNHRPLSCFCFFFFGRISCLREFCCHKRLKLCLARSAYTSNPKGTAILSKNFSHKATVFHAQCRERNSACAKFTLPFSPLLICFTGKEAIQDMTRTMKITVKMKKIIKNLQVVFKLVSLHYFFKSAPPSPKVPSMTKQSKTLISRHKESFPGPICIPNSSFSFETSLLFFLNVVGEIFSSGNTSLFL